MAMRVWRAHVTAVRSRLVHPRDGRQTLAAGRGTIRVLLLGSGPIVGWGVGSHELALPGAVARALAACTGRGAVVDVVPHPSVGVGRLRRLLDGAGYDRYDAVVLTTAVADAMRLPEPRRWGERLRRVLLHAGADGARTVVWVGAQPIRSIPTYDSGFGQLAEEHAERLNAVARSVCDETGALFVALDVPPREGARRHRGPADYLFWARQIVDVLGPAVQEHEASAPSPVTDGSARVQAIERLKLSGHRSDPRIEAIVGTAKRTLGAEVAMFTVLDDRHQWPLAATADILDQVPVEQSACIHTIQTADGMVIPNAAEDERFAQSDLVAGPLGLRYYAGYPVEAPDGTRIGALCVFGRTPRRAADGEADLDVLRELAMLAQRELWRWAPDDPS
jgi:hypothetical protein